MIRLGGHGRLQTLQTFADFLVTGQPTHGCFERAGALRPRDSGDERRTRRLTMKHVRNAIFLWILVALTVRTIGGRDTLTALTVVLALSAVFHSRGRVRAAARRTLQHVAGLAADPSTRADERKSGHDDRPPSGKF
jgi:hypothetical protein